MTSQKPEILMASEPWYHGLLPREDMKVLLTHRGDFLVRFTDPKPGESRKFVISVCCGNGEESIRHYVLRQSGKYFSVDEKWFNSIAELLNYYHRSKEPLTPNSPETILVQPIGREPWEKQHTDVKLLKKLGEGAFGEVQLGEIRVGTTTRKAAIKLAKLEALTKEQIKEIMHEARLMRQFKHANVVKFYGVAAGIEPLMVIMELADNGALDSYLKKNQATLTIQKKSEMILQAARGLEYLHSLTVIHRDIAARNCLYGGGQVKISDFGLSRNGSQYRLNPYKKIPIRWLAPEVPRTGFYTFKSDVFAYGIMCWEVYHDGEEPYPGMKVADVLPRVQEGYRMPFRPDVPEAAAAYLTNNVCTGDDYTRVQMSDIISQLPTKTGVEANAADVDDYFNVPEQSVKEQRIKINNILPQPSNPVPSSMVNQMVVSSDTKPDNFEPTTQNGTNFENPKRKFRKSREYADANSKTNMNDVKKRLSMAVPVQKRGVKKKGGNRSKSKETMTNSEEDCTTSNMGKTKGGFKSILRQQKRRSKKK